MIDNRQEYARMYEVERSLWWYQILHGRIYHKIQKHFGKQALDIKILDAACGTGGLLSFLREKGFTRLSGFDYSPHAIDFSKSRDLEVGFGDLKKVNEYRPKEYYDVIICNDALYFLTDNEIINALSEFKKRLNPNGLLLINIHAFDAFAGTHDIAVGSSRRFTLTDFKSYTQAGGLSITYSTYWPFILSFPILAVRQWQRLQLKRGSSSANEVVSDVEYPGDIINSVLAFITSSEQALFPRTPFGSSLFLVVK